MKKSLLVVTLFTFTQANAMLRQAVRRLVPAARVARQTLLRQARNHSQYTGPLAIATRVDAHGKPCLYNQAYNETTAQLVFPDAHYSEYSNKLTLPTACFPRTTDVNAVQITDSKAVQPIQIPGLVLADAEKGTLQLPWDFVCPPTTWSERENAKQSHGAFQRDVRIMDRTVEFHFPINHHNHVMELLETGLNSNNKDLQAACAEKIIYYANKHGGKTEQIIQNNKIKRIHNELKDSGLLDKVPSQKRIHFTTSAPILTQKEFSTAGLETIFGQKFMALYKNHPMIPFHVGLGSEQFRIISPDHNFQPFSVKVDENINYIPTQALESGAAENHHADLLIQPYGHNLGINGPIGSVVYALCERYFDPSVDEEEKAALAEEIVRLTKPAVSFFSQFYDKEKEKEQEELLEKAHTIVHTGEHYKNYE